MQSGTIVPTSPRQEPRIRYWNTRWPWTPTEVADPWVMTGLLRVRETKRPRWVAQKDESLTLICHALVTSAPGGMSVQIQASAILLHVAEVPTRHILDKRLRDPGYHSGRRSNNLYIDGPWSCWISTRHDAVTRVTRLRAGRPGVRIPTGTRVFYVLCIDQTSLWST